MPSPLNLSLKSFQWNMGGNWWMFLRVRGGVFLYLFAKIMDSVQMAKCYGGKVWVNLAFY